MLSGQVAEMATGEGKTLSGALAAAAYAAGGRSVHVMSVNDYLARRDADWMRPLYDLLGVTVGCAGQASSAAERRRAYAAQVTYAPVSEIGFDVLRDRFLTDAAAGTVPEPDVALIDEADSVLIDEARVPLVLAGSAAAGEADRMMAEIARSLRPRLHYEVDEDARNVQLTEAGARAAEHALGGIDLYGGDQLDALTRLYATMAEKERAIAGEVSAAHATGRPVLIGTLDIVESERIAGRLALAGLGCAVLNAKNDAEEAAIVAEAGARSAITVSTQMAGRGTDIRLGGRKGDDGQVAALGGLYVIGTGRYWSSRLDNQLRGRSGRQGDPGSSVFVASMEDQLVEHYAPDADPPRDVAADGGVADPGAHWTVDHAQRVAEGANLEIHRNTWRYSKLVEDQRRLVLEQRHRVLTTDAARQALARRCPQRYAELSATAGPEALDEAARQIVLYHLDAGWADHLAALASIREGIHLRALGRGLNPLSEFHREAVTLFSGLLRD